MSTPKIIISFCVRQHLKNNRRFRAGSFSGELSTVFFTTAYKYTSALQINPSNFEYLRYKLRTNEACILTVRSCVLIARLMWVTCSSQ